MAAAMHYTSARKLERKNPGKQGEAEAVSRDRDAGY
jgi:hypothetical protein